MEKRNSASRRLNLISNQLIPHSSFELKSFSLSSTLKSDEDWKTEIKKNLKEYEPFLKRNRNISSNAAVLMLIFQKDGELHVLLTKRSSRLNSHAGDMSFPGGKMDPEDSSLLHTALRETQEEIGLDPKEIEILGELNQILSKNLILVTPFVGWISNNLNLNMNRREVDEILSVPLRLFIEAKKHLKERESERLFPFTSRISSFFFPYEKVNMLQFKNTPKGFIKVYGMTCMLILLFIRKGLKLSLPDFSKEEIEAMQFWIEEAQTAKD